MDAVAIPANNNSGIPSNGPGPMPVDPPMNGATTTQGNANMADVSRANPAVAGVAPPVPTVGTASGSIDDRNQELDAGRQYRSKVNGLGMWSAWERNFSNKLKACLDLVDNAVDAALWDSDDEEDEEENEGRPLTVQERWKKQSGGIQISTEKHRLAMGEYDSDEERDEEDHSGDNKKGNDDNDAEPKPPPFIIHDVLGSFGGKMKNNENKDPGAAEDSNGFRLIDDENTLCLHNDCVNPVKELRKILDVYNSDKTESAIGENGVGVKQAAAAMSDLSIVVTTRIDEEPLLMEYGDLESGEHSVKRIRKCLISVGVLAKKMQSKDACVIPSWTIPIEFNIDESIEKKTVEGERKNNNGNASGNNKNDDDDDINVDYDGEFTGDTCLPVLMRELSKITSNDKLLGKSMREFGGAAAKNRRKYGIQRLAKHIELMVSSPSSSKKKKKKKVKPPHPHQYLMILHKFGKHGRNGATDDAAIVKARNELDDLLRDLAEEMPRTYLHVPPATYFKVRINNEVLKFQYWERNLVELHQIPLIVDRRNDFRTAEDWLIPANLNDTYEIKVSIGFDPSRANPFGSRADPNANTFIGGQACSLLIFSRISGRLFLKHDDARGVLRLTNSGTHFCQGLTIIVDDFEGHLPLTPTKESLAFGIEDYGKIHERNLYAWLGALAHVYWNHFHTMYKSKAALGNAIKAKKFNVSELEKKDPIDIPTLRFGSFSGVQNVCFSRERVRESIRPYKSELTKWIPGPSTLIKLGASNSSKPKKKPGDSNSNPNKRKATDMSALDGYDSDGNDLMDGAPPPSIFDGNAQALGNGQSEAQDDTEKQPVRRRLDGRPVRATREPQRFEEIPETPKKKKQFKRNAEKGGDARLKKKLDDAEAALREMQLELHLSKATCDDLQIQLEEVEHAGAGEKNQVIDLKRKLNERELEHKTELERLKEDHAKQLNELKLRLRELEEKKV